jgi:hypothetical protein
MASIKYKIVRFPADKAEQEVTVANLTDPQAEAAAANTRYWVAPVGNLIIFAIPTAT